MTIRGLKTMALRVEAENSTALRMARLLERHPKIERVHYPGLNSSRWHEVAQVQMAGYGGVVTFEMKSDLHGTMRFIDALEIPFVATSLGGCESLVQQPDYSLERFGNLVQLPLIRSVWVTPSLDSTVAACV